MEGNIEEFCRYLKVDKQMSESTVISYKRDIKSLAKYLKQKHSISDVNKINELHINNYLKNEEKSGKADTTISRRISSFRRFFSFLIKNHKINNYPVENIKNPVIHRKQIEYLTFEEVEKLLSVPNGSTDKDIRDKALIELVYATGMKVTELINLKVGDININLGYIQCGNGDNARVLPITQIAQLSLYKYIISARKNILKGENDFLFLNMKGKKLSRQGFWKIIKHYAKKSGIRTDITPNMLRHSFAKHLLENGADLTSVKELLGHVSISSTQVYAEKCDAKLRDVYLNSHPLAKNRVEPF